MPGPQILLQARVLLKYFKPSDARNAKAWLVEPGKSLANAVFSFMSILAPSVCGEHRKQYC